MRRILKGTTKSGTYAEGNGAGHVKEWTAKDLERGQGRAR